MAVTTERTNLAQEVADRMKTKEAAAYVGLARNTLEKMRNEGRGPRYLKLGSRVFYRKRDLDTFLAGQVVETTDSRAAA